MIKRIWQFVLLLWRNEPVRTWRKLDNGKYICDGDCGRWSLHGVCTCGLCHYFKTSPPYHHKIERDNISWRREYQTRNVMQNVEYITECDHGLSFNDECTACQEELEIAMEKFWDEWNKNHESNSTTS
jgi:hypothetical protein